MNTRWLKIRLAAFVAALALSTFAQATDHFATLHAFSDGKGVGNPAFPLTADSAGNLYGVTFWGGNFNACGGSGCGGVYRLTPNGSQWAYTLLYAFSDKHGAEPSQLILDSAGNLYGELSADGLYGNGSVFELSPSSTGPWKFTSLYDFTGGTDGGFPTGGLVFDKSGNLYGATAFGGSLGCNSNDCGAVFELSPNAGGGWTETVLHSFTGSTSTGGLHPITNLVFDAAGNLYGATSAGGLSGCSCGVIYQLQPSAGGWVFNTVYSFTGGSDGANPEAGLALDASGNLFGTTAYGGTRRSGTIFELTPSSGGWSFQLVHGFTGGNGGGNTYNPVLLDSSGNLYGATLDGTYGWGVAFELSPTSSGWTYSLLHTFTGGGDGGYPNGLILDAAGNLYGVSNYGAKAGCINQSGCGTVFKLSPASAVRH